MSVAAIICEYNPFHNGHKYQIDFCKKDIGKDGIVAVMSGNFVQRGAPTLCNKWERTKMALAGGCDLVIELPTVFATQSAERFAFGGVSLANSLNICNYLCFGSECDDVLKLKECAQLIESSEIKKKTDELLKTGVSYPVARQKALGDNYADIISEPNNILGIEYIKAIEKIKGSLKAIPLKREGCSHDAELPTGKFASASYLRGCIKSGIGYESYLPKETVEILENAELLKESSILDNILAYLLRTLSPSQLSEISDVSEGLEYRFKEAANTFKTFEEISEFVKTKRYTKTRIDRILINILLSVKKEDVKKEPCYIRVLGFNEKGQNLLSEIKRKSSLPIITKVKNADLTPQGEEMLSKDIYATDIYSLINGGEKNGLDYTTSPIVMKGM